MQSVVDAIKRSSRSGEWEAVEVLAEEPDANQNLCGQPRNKPCEAAHGLPAVGQRTGQDQEL